MKGSTVMVCLLTGVGLTIGKAHAADPWADAVVSYHPGTTAVPGYTNPLMSLGEPSRFTADPNFPSVVSIFSAAFLPDQIVSIGEGGHLTVRFDEPVVDGPANPYGVDLIVFGNAFFAADFSNFPSVAQENPARLFDSDLLHIELSADGINFFPIARLGDRLFPTQGYLDSGAFEGSPGAVPTNFRRPVNPSLGLANFNGLSYADSLALYDGSGGGLPIDISQTGLGFITHVRFSLPDDGNPQTSIKGEIDALAAVPEPVTVALTGFGLLLARARLRRRRMRG